MKIKLLVLFLPLLCFGQKQDETFKVKFRVPGAEKQWEREFIVKGSPYLNKEFVKGQTFLYGKIHEERKMRYNAYYDHIEILEPDSTISHLIKNADIDADINDKIYRFVNYLDHQNKQSGFLTPLNDGRTVLYSRTKKIISNPYLPEHGYEQFQPPQFIVVSSYYIKRPNKDAVPLLGLSRKEVFAVLWDKYNALRKFAKENKIQLRTEEEVISVLAYYDHLQKEEKETFEN